MSSSRENAQRVDGHRPHDNATVSVVVTTRDRPELLRRALAAIAAQTHPGVVETVVVFDRSAIDHGVESSDPLRPVRVMSNERTPGLPGGRNTGARHVVGEFLCWCDDDDVWAPDKVSEQLALFGEREWLDTVFTGITVVPRGQEPRIRVPPADELTYAMLLHSRVMEAHISTAMCRTTAHFEKIGDVDEEIPGGYHEDYDWTLRAARDRPIGIVRRPLVDVHWSGNSFFQDRFVTIDQASEYLLAKHPEFETDAEGFARLTGQQAFYRAASGKRRAALELVRQAFKANWREPRVVLTLAVVLGIDPNRLLRVLNARGRSI